MRIIRATTEEDMVAAFLRGEIESTRFRKHILAALRQMKAPLRLVLNPDLGSRRENETRARLLTMTRGYRTGYKDPEKRNTVFNTFPSRVKWYRASLTKNELMKVRYIKWPGGWTDSISKGTRLPIRSVNDLEKHPRLLSFSDAFAHGKKFPELIIVAATPRSRLVVMEGNSRITGMIHHRELLPKETEVILGLSERIRGWVLY